MGFRSCPAAQRPWGGANGPLEVGVAARRLEGRPDGCSGVGREGVGGRGRRKTLGPPSVIPVTREKEIQSTTP